MTKVFISYSHEDRDNIAPIVELLRGTMRNSVFQDYRDIPPGKKWRENLMDALQKARTVVVFWCEHSSKSDFVKKEYEFAVDAEKDVMPLLMDDTEMPVSLKAYQWVDFRRYQLHAPPAPQVYQEISPHGYHYPGEDGDASDDSDQGTRAGWEDASSGEGEEGEDLIQGHVQILGQDRTAAVKLLAAELEKRWSD